MTFWLGLLASVPLAVLANLLTPWLQDRWARRNYDRARRRVAVRERELAKVASIRGTPGALTEHLLVTVLSIVAIFAVTTLITSAVATVVTAYETTQVLSPPDVAGIEAELEHLEEGEVFFDQSPAFVVTQVSYLVTQLIFLPAMLAVTVLALNTLRLVRRVRNYETYTRETKARIDRLVQNKSPNA